MARVSDGTPVSVRLPAEVLAELRKQADEDNETLSDVLRRAALKELGYCPTCGQKAPAASGNNPGKDPC